MVKNGTLEKRPDSLDSAGNAVTTAHYPQGRREFCIKHRIQMGSGLSRSSIRLLFAVTLEQFFLADLFLKRIILTQVRNYLEIITGVGLE